jgi:uncharacterized membrane protein
MAAADQRTFGERVSDAVSEFGGSWKFIIVFSCMLIVWIIINSLPIFFAWDKYPYILLNLMLSFVAAFQAPFIMMSQNRAEAKQDEAYRQLFYEIKELVQKDIETSATNKQELREIRAEIKTIKKMLDR